MLPSMNLTFRHMISDPWQGSAIARWRNREMEIGIHEGLSAREREEIRWYIEEFMDLPESGNLIKAEQVVIRLQEYGFQLWQSLPEQFRNGWLASVLEKGRGQLVLQAETTSDEIALRTPWELLRPEGGRWLHELNVAVVRQTGERIADDTSSSHRVATDLLRVLVVICRPDNVSFLDPRYTPQALLDAVEEQPIELTFCRPGTRDAIKQHLRQAADDGRPFHVLHFDGHGDRLHDGQGVLLMEWPDGSKDTVPAEMFGDDLTAFQIPVVVLEACRTADKTSSQETVASALLRRGVGAVMAMSHSVHVDMTREFMAGFYRAIAAGDLWNDAVESGRRRIIEHPSRRVGLVDTISLLDWFTPQWYSNTTVESLAPNRQDAAGGKIAKKLGGAMLRQHESGLHNFPSAPSNGFHGRASDLFLLERLMLRHSVVVMHAPPGTGKTTIAREAADWWLRTGMFPDGAVYVSLEGGPSVQRVISIVGQAIEGPAFRKRGASGGRRWLSQELQQRRILIIWDNYEYILPPLASTELDVAGFARLAGEWTSGESRLLVASNAAQTGLESVVAEDCLTTMRLEGLALPDATTLLSKLCQSSDDEPKIPLRDVAALAAQVGCHALALELIAPHIARNGIEQTSKELGAMISARDQPGQELQQAMEATLDYAIRHLSPEARKVLPAVSLMTGGFSDAVAWKIAGLDGMATIPTDENGEIVMPPWRDEYNRTYVEYWKQPNATNKGLVLELGKIHKDYSYMTPKWQAVRDELVRSGLLQIDGHYVVPHPVLYEVCRDQVTEEDVARFCESVMLMCSTTSSFLKWPSVWLSSEFGDDVNAVESFARMEPVIRRAVSLAVACGYTEFSHNISGAYMQYLDQQGRSSEKRSLRHQLAGQRLSEEQDLRTPTDVYIVVEQARALKERKSPREALSVLLAVKEKLKQTDGWDTRIPMVKLLNELAELNRHSLGDIRAAWDCFEEAHVLTEEFNNNPRYQNITYLPGFLTSDEINTYLGKAKVLKKLGRYTEALQLAASAAKLARSDHNFPDLAGCYTEMGLILEQIGDFDQAMAIHELAVSEARACGDHSSLMSSLQRLGVLETDQARLTQAWDHLQEAYHLAKQVDDEGTEMRLLITMGNLDRARENLAASLKWYADARELAIRLQDSECLGSSTENSAVVLSELAQRARMLKQDEARAQKLIHRALQAQQECLELRKKSGDPAYISIAHSNMANFLLFAGEYERAKDHALKSLHLREAMSHSPDIWRTLGILGNIAEAQGDLEQAKVYRERCRQAAVGTEGDHEQVTLSLVKHLLKIALSVRSEHGDLEETLKDAGAPPRFLEHLEAHVPGISEHAQAIASNQMRPAVALEVPFQDVLQSCWDSVTHISAESQH